MRLETNDNRVTIYGEIKSIEDYDSLKRQFDALITSHKLITILIHDSTTITSSVLGYLIKLIFLKEIKLHLEIRDSRLYRMLEELELLTVLNVTKVG